MREVRRGFAPRIGITSLNVLMPGVGLLRAGDLRRALIVYAVAVSALLFFIGSVATTSDISFVAYAALVVIVFAVTLAAYVVAFWWTWRGSRVRAVPLAIWSRWYVIVAAILFSFAISWALSGISRSLYRNFYLPAEGMAPTLMKNDHLLASMRRSNGLRRGDVVLVETPAGTMYVKRLAALPGDRISLRNGLVFINGQASDVRPAGTKLISYPDMGRTEAHLYLERFPSEANPHLIQDLGFSDMDDMPELTVSPRHVFVLGDNRDDSADSRVPKAIGGLEQVPIDDVKGRGLFLYWPLDKMGRSLRTTK